MRGCQPNLSHTRCRNTDSRQGQTAVYAVSPIHAALAAKPYSAERPPCHTIPSTGQLLMAQSPQNPTYPLESGSLARMLASRMSRSLPLAAWKEKASGTGHVGDRARPQLSPRGCIATGQAPPGPIITITTLLGALSFLPPRIISAF